jgi:heme O synthase-like polyprenyltransferase
MDCGTWLVTLLKVGMPVTSLLIVVSIFLIEQNKSKSEGLSSAVLGSFFGYFSLFFSSQYVNSSGQKWRYLFIVSLLFLLVLFVIMKTANLNQCL